MDELHLLALNGLLDTGGETDVSHALIIGVTNDGGVVTRAASEGTTIADLVLDVADDGTFGHLTERDDVTDGNFGLLTAVDGLTGVHTFSSKEELLIELVVITRNYKPFANKLRISEGDASERSTTTRIVNNLSNNTLDVTVTLGIVQSTELRNTLAKVSVSHKDGSLGTLSLTYTIY